MDRLNHERAYRGADLLERLASLRVLLAGAGAIGSNLADNLARLGVRDLRVVDRDIVAASNVGTQLYGDNEVGIAKPLALKNRLFRTCGLEIEALHQEWTTKTSSKLLSGRDLCIDAFDNSASRRRVQEGCRKAGVACLHIGMNTDYAEILWDEGYRVPNEVGPDVCDYPLSRHLVLLAATVASETILRYAATREQQNWTITLRDLAIRRAEG